MINTDFANIHLRYSNDDWDTNTAQELNVVRNVPLPETDRISGITLRGRKYSHRRFSHTVRSVTISADELATSAKLDFILEFYKAGAWSYSEDGVAWTEVVLEENGRLDLQFIEDWVALPEVTLTLSNKEAD